MRRDEKSLTEYLVDVDPEFDVLIKSIKNIQDDRYLLGILKVLSRFFMKTYELGNVSALKEDPLFPNAGLVRVYEVKSKIGIYQNPDVLLQQISLETGIPPDRFSVEVWPEPDLKSDELPVLTGSDYEKVDNSDLVGQKRITTIIQKLEAENEQRRQEAANKFKKVVVDHLSLGDYLGESKLKGFYTASISDGQIVVESGPFPEKPRGPYIKTLNELRKRVGDTVS